MQLTIDTSKDSKEDIRNVIKMLQAYVGDSLTGHDSQNSDFSIPNSDSSSGMFSIFGGDSNDDEDKNSEPQMYEEKKEPDSQKVQIVEY